MINSERVFIKEFSPEMEVLNKPFQDCFYDLLDFNAGDNYKVFNEFLLNDTIDYNKAIFLHSLPEDVEFYKKNEFEELEENMQPFFSVDEDFTPLYLALREVHMNYDD